MLNATINDIDEDIEDGDDDHPHITI